MPVGSADSETNDAQSDAPSPIIDPNLAKIVAAWPSLREPIRRAMLALIG
jgi:hypothetical protein